MTHHFRFLSRSSVFGCLLATTAVVTSQSPAETSKTGAPEKPNIVLIYADDLDFDQIGAYDHRAFPSFSGAQELGILEYRGKGAPGSKVLTPHIDSLARDGARFTRFYVTSPVCTPSRYSAVTGRFASKSQTFRRTYADGSPAAIGWDTYIAPSESTIADKLGELGYFTGHVGKWHLTPAEDLDIAKKKGDSGDPARADVSARLRQEYAKRAKYLRDSFGFDFVGSLYVGNLGTEGLNQTLRHHNMEWVTHSALNFIDTGVEDDRPFFLYMAPTLLHGPYSAKHLDGDPRATALGLVDIPNVQPSRENIRQRVSDAGLQEDAALSTWLDDAVGAVLARLEKHGIADNTLIMLISDHQSRGKFTLYEAAHVPALARWPKGIPANKRIDALCANIDLVPTFVAMAGGDPRQQDIDGVSMLPLFGSNSHGEIRNSLYLEIAYARAVIQQDWKYIAVRYPDEVLAKILRRGKVEQATWNGKIARDKKDRKKTAIRYNSDRYFPNYSDLDQLYNLDSDPYEQRNLAKRTGFEERLAAMKKLMAEKLRGMPHSFGEFKALKQP